MLGEDWRKLSNEIIRSLLQKSKVIQKWNYGCCLLPDSVMNCHRNETTWPWLIIKWKKGEKEEKNRSTRPLNLHNTSECQKFMSKIDHMKNSNIIYYLEMWMAIQESRSKIFKGVTSE